MKDFITGVLATAAIIVLCSCTETIWEPTHKTGGSGTQAVGESDLVLPGAGAEVATAQELVVVATTFPTGMTDAEKLALIDTILDDAFEHFWDMDDTQVWKGVALAVADVVDFGGENS